MLNPYAPQYATRVAYWWVVCYYIVIMEILAETLDVIGKIMIAYAAIMVHYRFRKEHKIDEQVFHSMRREQIGGIVGVVLIVAGYVLRLLL